MAWNSFSSPNAGGAAQAYARVALETGVASSDPRRLLVMLYDGVLKCLAQAKGHMQRRDAAANDMTDFFDFTHRTFADPPTLPAATISAQGVADCAALHP